MFVMSDEKKARLILERGFAEWRKQQTLERVGTSINEFANYLGYSRSAVGFWLNGKNPLSEEALNSILPKLVPLLGIEIYDELGIPRTNYDWYHIQAHWVGLPDKAKKEIRDITDKYTIKKE